MPHSQGFGAIVGIVAEDGVPKVNAPVRLYDRTTGQLVREARSVADGGYVFSGLSTETDDYIVMATDEDGTPKKNALVYDRIRPISAQQGDTYYAAWRLIVGKYNPIRWVCGRFYDQTEQTWLPVNHGKETVIAKAESGQIWVHEGANLPGDPSLTRLELRSGVAFITGNESSFVTISHYDYTEGVTLSYFFIIDFTTPWGYKEYSNNDRNTGSAAITAIFRCKYSGTVLTVQIRSSSVFMSDDETNWTTICDYTPPGGLTGLHSLTVAVYLGGVSKTYVDGVEVANTDTTSIVRYPYIGTNSDIRITPTYAKFTDSSYGAGIGQKLVALGLFKGLFRAEEALELHNAFFTVNPPNVTGYKKEVILDGPQVFYVFNSTSNAANHFMCLIPSGGYNSTTLVYKNNSVIQNGTLRIFPKGSLLTQQLSPITGEVATNFTNGCYRCSIGANPSNYYFGIEAILKRTTTSAPTGNEYIIRVVSNYYGTSYVEFWRFNLTTARKLQISISAAAVETITTTYSLPDSEFVHVFLQVNRIQGKWYLHVNGLPQEQGNTAAVYPAKFYNCSSVNGTNTASAVYYTTLWTQETEIGGLWNNSNVMSNNFKGDIAAIAMYSGPTLSDARVLAHYNALGII